MPNVERNIPAVTNGPAELAAMFVTPLSDRVARLTEAANVANDKLVQAATPERANEAGPVAVSFALALAQIEHTLNAVGF